MAKVDANIIESGIFILRSGEITGTTTDVANHNEIVVHEDAVSPKLYLGHSTGGDTTELHGIVMDKEWNKSIQEQRMIYNGETQSTQDSIALEYTGPDGFDVINGSIVNVKANVVCKTGIGENEKVMAMSVSAQIHKGTQEYISSVVEYTSNEELGNISFEVDEVRLEDRLEDRLKVKAQGTVGNTTWQVEVISLVQV